MKTTIYGVFVEVTGGEMDEKEIKGYLFHLMNEFKPRTLSHVTIAIDGDYVDLHYWLGPEKFERIRRVTGYLTGNLKYWNNAKQAEERDRVKHI